MIIIPPAAPQINDGFGNPYAPASSFCRPQWSKSTTSQMGQGVFLAILRDIKKDMESGKQPSEAVTAAMFQTMRNALAKRKQIPFSIDDVTAMVAGQIGQLATMDEEAVDLFQQLAKKMITQTEKM